MQVCYDYNLAIVPCPLIESSTFSEFPNHFPPYVGGQCTERLVAAHSPFRFEIKGCEGSALILSKSTFTRKNDATLLLGETEIKMLAGGV